MSKCFLMKNDISCVFDGLSETGRIFICNMPTAHQVELLQKQNIKAVISISRTSHPQYSEENVEKHLIIRIEDVPDSSINAYFQQTYQFIDLHRKTGNVLVHCMAGISRSATVVIAYLMKKYAYDFQTVFSMIKRKRNKVNPNQGFVHQLKKYQQELGIARKLNSPLKAERRAKTPSFGSFGKHCRQQDKLYDKRDQSYDNKYVGLANRSKLSQSVQKQKRKYERIQDKLAQCRPPSIGKRTRGLGSQDSPFFALVTLNNNF